MMTCVGVNDNGGYCSIENAFEYETNITLRLDVHNDVVDKDVVVFECICN